MWAIITRLEDGNFDIIPTTWITTKDECLYPNVGLAAAKKLAKSIEPSSPHWDKMQICIEKENIGKLYYNAVFSPICIVYSKSSLCV